MNLKTARNAPFLIFVFALALLSSAGVAGAQSRQGDTELGFSFDFDDLAEGSDSRVGLTLRAGRFFGPLEVGVEFATRGPWDDFAAMSTYRLFSAYELNPGQTTVFYGRGGFLGRRDSVGGRTLTTEYLELGVGAKQYLRDDTALYWETTYGFLLSGFQDRDNLRTVTGLVCTF